MIYMYWISLGLASLHKASCSGDDIDQKPKKIGRFKSDKEAKEACLAHWEKACKMARARGDDEPLLKFI